MSRNDYIKCFMKFCEEKEITFDETELTNYIEKEMKPKDVTLKCMYKMTKGANQGKMCGKDALPNYILCKACCSKKLFAKQIPGLLESETDPFVRECIVSTQKDKFANSVVSTTKAGSSPKSSGKVKTVMTGFLQYHNNQLLHEGTGCVCKRLNDTEIICLGGMDPGDKEALFPLTKEQIEFCIDKGINYIENEDEVKTQKKSKLVASPKGKNTPISDNFSGIPGTILDQVPSNPKNGEKLQSTHSLVTF